MTFQQLAVVSPQETDNNIYRAYYYDRKGRVILTKELDREGNPSCYWVKYDDAGHILTTVEEHRIPDSNLPDFKRVDYTYDAQGRMLNETTTVDREGSAIRSVSTFVYDEFDRLSSKTTDGITESYGHDFYGRLTGQASPYFRQGALLCGPVRRLRHGDALEALEQPVPVLRLYVRRIWTTDCRLPPYGRRPARHVLR